MAQDFGQVLIDALEAGKESKRRVLRNEWEKEDRDVEKQILQHRLREIKIGEKLKKRELGAQNLKLMEGTPEMDIPENMWEPMDDPNAIATVPGTIQQRRRFTPMSVPGVEELGVPDMQYRPQTYEQSMERTLAEQIQKLRQEALWKPVNIGEGARRILPATGEVLAEGNPRTFAPRAPIRTTERDATGVETDRFIPPEEVVGRSFTRQPLPRQAGGGSGGGGQAGDVEVEDYIEGVASGRIPASNIPKSALGVRISSGLEKKHRFNVAAALNDERAIRTFYSNMNADDMNQLRIMIGTTETSLTDLEALSEAWNGSGFPILSSAALALAKRGAYGDEAKQTAVDLESTIGSITDGLAQLSRGGAAPTNAALESASKALKSEWSASRLKTTITSLKKHLATRAGAIRGLEPLLPSGMSPGGGTNKVPPPGNGGGRITDGAAPGVAQGGALTPTAVAAELARQHRPSDPETVKKVMSNPEFLKALFGGK